MVNPRAQKNKNYLNLFLRNYFPAIIVVVLIIFLAFAYFVFLQPKFSATQYAIQANLDSEQSLLIASQKKLAAYRSMDSAYKKIDPADLRRFNAVLPDNYVPEKLYGEIEEMVSRGGWLISGVSVAKPKEEENPEEDSKPVLQKGRGEYDLQVSVEAIDYPGLKSLLKIFENNLRLYDVMKVDYTPDSGSAKIALKTYYYQAEK